MGKRQKPQTKPYEGFWGSNSRVFEKLIFKFPFSTFTHTPNMAFFGLSEGQISAKNNPFPDFLISLNSWECPLAIPRLKNGGYPGQF